MAREESELEMLMRHVAEGEARVAQQKAIIETMKRDHHPKAEAQGRRLLATMEETLRIARDHLEALQLGRGRREPGDRSD